jgi:hypothetical protein
MSGWHFLTSTRLVLGYLYSPDCLEEAFSETRIQRSCINTHSEGGYALRSPLWGRPTTTICSGDE